MAFGGLMQTLRTLREIDLGAIKAGSEAPFELQVFGPPDMARAYADRLSRREGAAGRHPWVNVADPQAPGLGFSRPTERGLALVLSRSAELPADEARRLAELAASGRRAIVVVEAGAAEPTIGVELARPGESARVLLTGAEEDEAFGAAIAQGVLKATADQTDLRLSLARHLPLLRPALIFEIIEEVSRTNALYAFGTGMAGIAPGMSLALGPADILVLTKNQLVMAYRIALASGKTGSTRELMTELVGVIGGGLLLRQIARELIGLVPVVGIVPKVAVAYAGTKVIGRSALAWADSGHRPSPDELRTLYREAMGGAQRFAEGFMARLPGRDGGADGA